MAQRLIFAAVDVNPSSSAGDNDKAPAILSNPRVESSDGRNFAGSISRASRSRIAFPYSVRLRRFITRGGRPVTVLRDRSCFIYVVLDAYSVRAGCGISTRHCI